MWQALAIDRVSKIKVHKVVKIAILVIFLIIAFRIAMPQLKKLLGMLKKSDEKKHVEELEESIDLKELTYPVSQYGIWADSLYTAMNGLGTDEQAIYDVFSEMRSNNDVAQLVVSFSVREDETLSQWLIGDLSDSEKKTVRKILSDRNITYNII